MIRQEIVKVIQKALGELGWEVKEIPLEHPESPEHGDYATSVAFALAKQVDKKPQEIAQLLAHRINNQQSTILDKVEAVGGFVNFSLSNEVFEAGLQTVFREKEKYGQGDSLKGKNIMVEYAHPNTHKEMHIGHMRTLITGEALSRIFEAAGAKVSRANYQGDIGPHVAKALWGTEQLLKERKLSWEDAEKLSLAEKAHVLGEGYVRGNKEYEEHEKEIDALNAKLYRNDKEVQDVYQLTRKWSLDYYDEFYKRFDAAFDKLYFESEVFEKGKEIVAKHVGKVFKESEGAVIFDGEKYGLHKRVFVTKDGNATYEGKEIALAPLQYKDFAFDKNIHVVANEQSGYFKVVFKALEQINKELAAKEYHLPMGMVQLVGAKMSSRTGVVITVDGLLEGIKQQLKELITNEELSKEEKEEVAEKGTIAAIKYSVLRTDTKANVAFDIKQSISLDGDSGPYLLYTYARARSILRKAQGSKLKTQINLKAQISKEEMDILRTMYKFPEVVQEAAEKYAPNMICSFVYDLAQKYNHFYNAHRVLEADTEDQKQFRLLLTQSVAQLIQNSLYLLGIKAPEKM